MEAFGDGKGAEKLPEVVGDKPDKLDTPHDEGGLDFTVLGRTLYFSPK
jgi:hypothetical protein